METASSVHTRKDPSSGSRLRDPARSVLSEGSGEPVVLLHGVTGSSKMWRRVVPLLAARHRVLVPTALGHLGGAVPSQRPTRIEHVIDDAERTLDELGLERAHLAGNSMGGWVALELAGRGRALSVCALSPAGAWEPGERGHASKLLARTIVDARRGRLLLPLLAQFGWFRRWALRDNAVHGDQVAPSELMDLVDDLLGCEVAHDLLATDEQLRALTTSCPVTLAWSESDRLFPVAVNGARARALVPDARFLVLPDVGHVPMLDNPQLVADTILQTIELARTAPSATVGAREAL